MSAIGFLLINLRSESKNLTVVRFNTNAKYTVLLIAQTNSTL